MQLDGKRKWFMMDPPAEAAAEPKPEIDVHAVLCDHRKYVRLILRELQLTREFNKELKMKVAELASKVGTLIAVANDLNGRVNVVVEPQDDPEVEALAHRIDDAIAVLKGEHPGTTTAGTKADAIDPNAPVTSEPSAAALATDINSPQARDPNAPM